MTATLNQNQCLLDLVVEYAGSASVLFAVAADNDLSPTDDVTTGQQIIIRDELINVPIAKYMSDKNYIPATKLTDSDLDGIGYDLVGIDNDIL